MTAPKKKPAKKPAAKPAKKTRPKPTGDGRVNRRSTAKKGAKRTAPRGARLPAAAIVLRDDLMMSRRASGWTWEMVAEESGISVDAARKAVDRRRLAAPMKLSHDPVKLVEAAMEGYVASIASFETLALQAAKDTNWAAAVGAKKGSNDARAKILALLQATGRLPQEMGVLRHLIDLRAIAVRMLDAVDAFGRAMTQLEVDAETRAAIDAGVLEVKGTFQEMIGFDEDAPPEEQPAIEGSATEA